MKIKKILSDIKYKGEFKNFEVENISYDSRKVVDGTLFVAIEGEKFNGHNFIGEAVENGAIAINSNDVVECGIQKNLKIVDLTGAGDLFAAGFLHGYVNNLSIKENLEKGTEMSSKVIQQIGARI